MYAVADLKGSERRVIAGLRRLMDGRDGDGRGYGELRITVKDGQIVTIRSEVIEQVRGVYE